MATKPTVPCVKCRANLAHLAIDDAGCVSCGQCGTSHGVAPRTRQRMEEWQAANGAQLPLEPR